MTLKQPTDMSECIYFTRRTIGKGKIKAWVLKDLCPKCKKALIGKPKDPKTGKPKIRATEYVCPECGFKINKKEYEESLTCNIEYTCPYCSFSGETQIPYRRKKVKVQTPDGEKSADSLRFQCQKCNKNIDITKKMK